jgi:hypothetical protein
MPQIEIIGVYSAEAPEPVHLIELNVRGADNPFAVGEFTQEVPDQPRSDWQVPYMEQILSADGIKIIADDSETWGKPELFRGDVRFVFFFHYLDLQQPLRTPFGEVQLPAESELPKRLSMIQYEEP